MKGTRRDHPEDNLPDLRSLPLERLRQEGEWLHLGHPHLSGKELSPIPRPLQQEVEGAVGAVFIEPDQEGLHLLNIKRGMLSTVLPSIKGRQYNLQGVTVRLRKEEEGGLHLLRLNGKSLPIGKEEGEAIRRLPGVGELHLLQILLTLAEVMIQMLPLGHGDIKAIRFHVGSILRGRDLARSLSSLKEART